MAVDLDGTLIKTDLLAEAFVKLIFISPWRALWALTVLLTRGRLQFKHFVFANVQMNWASIPLRESVLSLIDDYRKQGRRVVLATATLKSVAESFASAAFPGSYFDEVLGSDDAVNLKGPRKLALLSSRFRDGFAYVGDAACDVPIWRRSRIAYEVAPSPNWSRRLAAQGVVTHWIPSDNLGTGLQTRMKIWGRALRLHHWGEKHPDLCGSSGRASSA
ncbi:MAG: hypothetical protein HC902_02580 [Calothrix sp. SM1_5_4]|nr:hypothetical protein [Calothrix sp. SM1_5_4]